MEQKRDYAPKYQDESASSKEQRSRHTATHAGLSIEHYCQKEYDRSYNGRRGKRVIEYEEVSEHSLQASADANGAQLQYRADMAVRAPLR